MNIIRAVIDKGRVRSVTEALWQYDYGQVLQIEGLELPESYEVHFGNEPNGESTTSIGTREGVDIPDIYLKDGRSVYAWIYLHTGENDGETVYMIEIPVHKRSSITNAQPTPVQQDVITQTIAALNNAVSEVESIAEGIHSNINKITKFSATGFTTKKTFSGSSYATYSLTLTKSSWVNCRCYLGKIFIEGGDIRIGAIADISQASGGFLNILPAGTYTVTYIGSGSSSSGSVLVQDAV